MKTRTPQTWTKDAELTELRKLAERLGDNSYCGPWLRAVLPTVEAEMRSDLGPTPTPSDMRAEAARLREWAASLDHRERGLREQERDLQQAERLLSTRETKLRTAAEAMRETASRIANGAW
jgi:septal ring factor EnvC (AmiA/AmiB activator)